MQGSSWDSGPRGAPGFVTSSSPSPSLRVLNDLTLTPGSMTGATNRFRDEEDTWVEF